jgi:hypothetical protein
MTRIFKLSKGVTLVLVEEAFDSIVLLWQRMQLQKARSQKLYSNRGNTLIENASELKLD